jgi:hypothetical protein
VNRPDRIGAALLLVAIALTVGYVVTSIVLIALKAP